MDSSALHELSLEVAAERTPDGVLERIVRGLARQDHVALARVWLIAPGDICDSCPMAAECPDRTRCLHLAASDGRPREGRGTWRRLDGAFRRFPLNVRKIGRVGGNGEPILLEDVKRELDWIRRPDWIRKERIKSFGAQPLVVGGEVLGVLGIFSRERIDTEAFAWLKHFAEQAGVAIANARAFGEVEQVRRKLEVENAYLREEVSSAAAPGGIKGASLALRRALEQVELVAPTDTSVLVLGESGTGKELFARAIHERSRRRARPLVKVNCGSIPRELFESEFFGHVAGAFTGATRDRPGRFVVADQGTLFLDEVGEIPLELQPKLLRALQEGEFEPVGDDRTRRVDVRVVAATNRDLLEEVEAGRFRQDLYYRLSVFPVQIPPLRERPEDIAPLATHFVELAGKHGGAPGLRLSERDLEALRAYPWPGNVRELENVIERAVILARGGQPFDMAQVLPGVREPRPRSKAAAPRAEPAGSAFVTEARWRELERENLTAALEAARGKVYGPGGAAELLGLKPTTLVSRLKVLGLSPRGANGP